jgi:hypothetical protein
MPNIREMKLGILGLARMKVEVKQPLRGLNAVSLVFRSSRSRVARFVIGKVCNAIV